jgi:formylglycine-generating enzyme required for sulfatase activity
MYPGHTWLEGLGKSARQKPFYICEYAHAMNNSMGALGEYNGKFMVSQMVLRGGSCLSPRSHLRPTYRNFWHPRDRFQMTGIRLARDA